MSKISTYWKCQLFGWGIVSIIIYTYNNIIYADYFGFFYKIIIIFLFGISCSHLLRTVIKKLDILHYEFTNQIIWLCALSLLFSCGTTFIWLYVLIKSTIYTFLNTINSPIPFYKVYLFNLMYVFLTFSGWILIYFLVHYVKDIRDQERRKLIYEYKIVELEAKALRAQMNPHFIFNCMNSIKALIQKGEQEKSVVYLTTFSKLLRTVLETSNKREITLFDELETCRLYNELESLRFNGKFTYSFNVDQTLDLKSIMVPALIIQPFIENAIWHGIMPKEEGGVVTVKVDKWDNTIRCTIDDNGVGRETSKQNKFSSADSSHQSKGEHLTQARLNLDNLLNERNAGIQIIDKHDMDNKSCGTTIIINFSEY